MEHMQTMETQIRHRYKQRLISFSIVCLQNFGSIE